MMRAPNALALPQTQAAQPVYYDANNVWQWDPYAVGGATRPDSFTGMNPQFETALEQMFASAPPEIRDQLQVKSGYRSVDRQAELWAAAVEKYGSEEEARRWVAPPGNSQHNHGNAADLGYLSPEAQQWAHANAANYGLAFPLSNEDWHIELATARGGQPMGGTGGGQTGSGTYGTTAATGSGNALALPEIAQAVQQQQRDQQFNALLEGFNRPIYTNTMRGSVR
jgi:hypothetical protein